VTPVAGGVAHTNYYKLVLGFSLGKAGFIPCLPVYGVVGVLQQVGAGFKVQFVHVVKVKTIKLIIVKITAKPLED